MQEEDGPLQPILCNKQHEVQSAFTPESILREARRQKGLNEACVPAVCVLDPDGDMVRYLKQVDRAHRDPGWACYHTELYRTTEADLELGIVPCAVGASFAVLIAEQLFARLLISVTSSGQLVELRSPPYFVLIDKALRDEGTSYHYLPPAEFSAVSPSLLEALDDAFIGLRVPVERGATWSCAKHNTGQQTLVAHGIDPATSEIIEIATNRMGSIVGDFEKGEADGARHLPACVRAGSGDMHRGGSGRRRRVRG
jgi:Phosphorylase superfamily